MVLDFPPPHTANKSSKICGKNFDFTSDRAQETLSPLLYWGWAFELLGSGFVSLSNEGSLDMISPVHRNVVLASMISLVTELYLLSG